MLSGMLFKSEANCIRNSDHWDKPGNIQCRNCGFGCDKAGSVIVQYDEETMNPIADDHGLRKLIRDWDSILRDPDRERLADI